MPKGGANAPAYAHMRLCENIFLLDYFLGGKKMLGFQPEINHSS